MVPGLSKTICFYGTCLANSSKVLVSPEITFPYRIDNVNVSFALGTNHTLRISPYLSYDSDAPVSGPPTGISLFAELGQVDYLTGDDEHEEHIEQHYNLLSESWLKIYAVNLDAFSHTIDAQIEIVEILEDYT